MQLASYQPAPEILENAARVIREGGVVLHPTDTLYGLACDPFCAEAVDRLIAIKGRPPERGLLLLVPDCASVDYLCDEIPEVFHTAARELWPGPFTFLLRAASRLPQGVRGKEGKVGVRQPDLPYLQSWMSLIPGPLVSTSANRSGEAIPGTLVELKRLLQGEVDLFLEAGEIENPHPSSVLDLTIEPPRIVREGREVERIKEFLERYQ